MPNPARRLAPNPARRLAPNSASDSASNPARRLASNPASDSASNPAAPAGPRTTAIAYGLVLVLALLLAVWGAFLVPLRVGAVLAPASWVIALVGNGLLGWAGGRLLGRAGAAGPGLLWLAVALTLGTKRAEGDLVIPGTLPGLVFLAVGAVASAAAYSLTPRRPAA